MRSLWHGEKLNKNMQRSAYLRYSTILLIMQDLGVEETMCGLPPHGEETKKKNWLGSLRNRVIRVRLGKCLVRLGHTCLTHLSKWLAKLSQLGGGDKQLFIKIFILMPTCETPWFFFCGWAVRTTNLRNENHWSYHGNITPWKIPMDLIDIRQIAIYLLHMNSEKKNEPTLISYPHPAFLPSSNPCKFFNIGHPMQSQSGQWFRWPNLVWWPYH